MIKFLIIVFLISYVLYRVGGFLFKLLFLSASQQRASYAQGAQKQSQSKRAPDSNLNIDFVPEDEVKKKKRFKGGDYVDYEEVD